MCLISVVLIYGLIFNSLVLGNINCNLDLNWNI